MDYERTYQEVWNCNFLGLAGSAEIPADMDPSQYVLFGMALLIFPPLCPLLLTIFRGNIDIRYDPYDDFTNTSVLYNHDPDNCG